MTSFVIMYRFLLLTRSVNDFLFIQWELDHIKTESLEVYTYTVSLCMCDLIQLVYVISIFRHVYFVNK